MNEWLWAAAVLTVAFSALVVVAIRKPLLEGLVALETAGTTATLVLPGLPHRRPADVSSRAHATVPAPPGSAGAML